MKKVEIKFAILLDICTEYKKIIKSLFIPGNGVILVCGCTFYADFTIELVLIGRGIKQ